MSVGTTTTPRRLIEIALPIREISAESVRDKSLRHGHISTLHLWWARRPLATARAIVFASLVPDPDDPACPPAFRELVEQHLKTNVPKILRAYRRKSQWMHDSDPYRPYEGIPDTPRNRLLTFIARWSPEWLAFERGERPTQPRPAEMLDDRSLVKWETSDPTNEQGQEILRIARELVDAAGESSPKTVLDPFSGGGAIPLEATRLGCQAIANDYNPVAYLILRATCEFPQRYGNKLAHDVENWATWVLERAREKIAHLYPPGKDGHPIVGYIWARTAPCSNPSCRATIPLLRTLFVCNTSRKQVALVMNVDQKNKGVTFTIAKGTDITTTDGTVVKKGVRCPLCGQITPTEDIKKASFSSELQEQMVAVIVDTPEGKDYRPLEYSDSEAFTLATGMVDASQIPNEPMQKIPDLVSGRGWNFQTWGSLFNPRQLVAMQTFVASMHDALETMNQDVKDEGYRQAIAVYLGLWMSRIAQRCSNMGIWHTSRETLEHPFGRQAIPMTWDYPESNPFSESTGGAEGGIEWVKRVLLREAIMLLPAQVSFGDSSYLPVAESSVDVAVTDPPYFDAIAYADLSDFFYVWLKRSLVEVFSSAFVTPLTPKTEEDTALKHRHGGSADQANQHFTSKLTACLAESRRVCKPDGVITVMFAHQSTEAWTALINAIFEAGLNVNATYPIDTEIQSALKVGRSMLKSSITVTCRPRVADSAASLKKVRKEINGAVAEAVKRFWMYGFRGADLIVACYGPAVSVFGRYESVERADGTRIEVPELLEMARAAARDAIAGEFRGDTVSTFYYVWSTLYGIGEQDWDDARLIVQLGGSEESAMEMARGHNIFVVKGSRCRLALLKDRLEDRTLTRAVQSDAPLIDMLHRAMHHWQQEQRNELIAYLHQYDLLGDGPFWKLAQALFDVLPHDTADWKIISVLLGERETLRLQAKGLEGSEKEQMRLGM